MDRTPACPRQPLRTSRSGWVCLCVCVCIHVTCVDVSAKTHLLYFVTCVVWGCTKMSSSCYLSARICQTTAIKASDFFLSVVSSASISLLLLISSFLLSKSPETFFFCTFLICTLCLFHSLIYYLFLDLSLCLLSQSLALLAIGKQTKSTFKESLTLLWLCGAALFRIEGPAGGEKNVFCHFTHKDLQIKLQSLSFPLVSVTGNRCRSASFLFWPLVDCFKNRLNEVI